MDWREENVDPESESKQEQELQGVSNSPVFQMEKARVREVP